MKNRSYYYKVLHIELSFQVIYHSPKLLCCQLWILKELWYKMWCKTFFFFGYHIVSMSIKLLTCKWARLSFSNLSWKSARSNILLIIFSCAILNEAKWILTKKIISDKWKQKILSRQDGVWALLSFGICNW